jgi:catechol 2,3-dioxygenase-like lactoylglutathione lyase family enzyme
MNAIKGVYEVAIKVHDLDRAEEFYREVLGLEVGLRDEPRRWVFLPPRRPAWRAGHGRWEAARRREPPAGRTQWPRRLRARTPRGKKPRAMTPGTPRRASPPGAWNQTKRTCS